MCFFFVCDQEQQVLGSTPVNGVCTNCGGAVADVKVRDNCRFCFVPVCWKTRHTIMCRNCGARLQ